jgi:hypothetical protein
VLPPRRGNTRSEATYTDNSTADKLPFDVGQFRTVAIDMTNIYTLVPQIELHRLEITLQCRTALADADMAESPLSRFCPQFG